MGEKAKDALEKHARNGEESGIDAMLDNLLEAYKSRDGYSVWIIYQYDVCVGLDKNGVGHYETRTRVKKYYQQGADVNSGWYVFGGQGGNNPEADLQKLSDFIAQVQKAGGR